MVAVEQTRQISFAVHPEAQSTLIIDITTKMEHIKKFKKNWFDNSEISSMQPHINLPRQSHFYHRLLVNLPC
jgi:LEA14-like dessication related protein